MLLYDDMAAAMSIINISKNILSDTIYTNICHIMITTTIHEQTVTEAQRQLITVSDCIPMRTIMPFTQHNI